MKAEWTSLFTLRDGFGDVQLILNGQCRTNVTQSKLTDVVVQGLIGGQ